MVIFNSYVKLPEGTSVMKKHTNRGVTGRFSLVSLSQRALHHAISCLRSIIKMRHYRRHYLAYPDPCYSNHLWYLWIFNILLDTSLTFDIYWLDNSIYDIYISYNILHLHVENSAWCFLIIRICDQRLRTWTTWTWSPQRKARAPGPTRNDAVG